MAAIILACMIGKVPLGVIRCYRALLDFIYLSQYPSHDEETLGYLQNALEEFHRHKSVLIDLGARDHLNIPKIHSLQHYIHSIRMFGTTDNYNTEMFERFHIDFCKEGWYASNKREEKPQMTTWLSRREKVSSFESYLKMTFEEEEDDEDTAFTHSKLTDQRIILRKHPNRSKQDINDIMDSHHCPGFEKELRSYLNQKNATALTRAQLLDAPLPFTSLDVFHSFRFSLHPPTGSDDIDFSDEQRDAVKARPKFKGQQDARFDTIIVMENDECQSTGLKGLSFI
jgi:hypothetical protein